MSILISRHCIIPVSICLYLSAFFSYYFLLFEVITYGIFDYISIFKTHTPSFLNKVLFCNYRCTVTLAIPILCSSKGRSVIIAAAFFLAATGPTVNIFHNIDVMVKSLTCGQMQLKQALSDMLDTLKKPLLTIKEAITNAIKELRNVLKEVQMVLIRIQELIVSICEFSSKDFRKLFRLKQIILHFAVASIKQAFSWLENIVKMCNTEFGTPYERCMNISQMAMEDCRSKMGPIKGLCQLTHVFSMLCYTAKIVDVICVLVDFVSDAIIKTVMDSKWSGYIF